MKKLFFYAAIGLVIVPTTLPVTAVGMAPAAYQIYQPYFPEHTFTVEEILSLSPKKYKALTGKKMSLKQQLNLYYVQHQLKKQIKRQEINLTDIHQDIDATDFNWVGLLLGLFLSIAGVFIAYLIGDKKKIKWAWIGFGLGAAIIIAALLLFK